MIDGELDKSLRKGNGRMRGTAHHKGKKVVYFDSNDEMVCGSEVSQSEEEDSLNTRGNGL